MGTCQYGDKHLELTLNAYFFSCAAGEGSSTSMATRPSTLPSAKLSAPLYAATQRVWYFRLLSRGGCSNPLSLQRAAVHCSVRWTTTDLYRCSTLCQAWHIHFILQSRTSLCIYTPTMGTDKKHKQNKHK